LAAGGYELEEFSSNSTTSPRCQDAAVFLLRAGTRHPS
jgi:hypothetical protein